MRIEEFGERPLNLYLLCVELQSFLQYSEEVFATSRYLQPSLLTGRNSSPGKTDSDPGALGAVGKSC
jgi:hypothetical protein